MFAAEISPESQRQEYVCVGDKMYEVKGYVSHFEQDEITLRLIDWASYFSFYSLREDK